MEETQEDLRIGDKDMGEQVTAGKGNYDITETRRDVYKYSKLYKLLWRVNQTMEDMLRTVQTDTLSEYTFFIENVRYVVQERATVYW